MGAEYSLVHRALLGIILVFGLNAYTNVFAQTLRGTGDLGVVIEREAGRVLVVENSSNTILSQVDGLENLSHASVVYSRDARYAYVFGRDGGLSKVDLLQGQLVNRVIQAGNSIGGAISQDGRLIAVSNYKPGGVRVFDADTLEMVADIPAVYGDGGQTSKVVGLVDAPGQRFVFSLWDAGEIWVANMKTRSSPRLRNTRTLASFLTMPSSHRMDVITSWVCLAKTVSRCWICGIWRRA